MENVIKLAIVGTNFISDYVADAAKLSQKCQAYAVYSRTKEKGCEFAEKHGISLVYCDFDEMLNNPDIDAVYIASPTFLHKEMAVKALNSGKHALIEKMISLNCAEFLEIKEASAKSGKIFLEAMRPDFDKTFALIEENLSKIGKIREAYFEFCQYSSRYDNFKRGIVENAFNPELKNSALSDLGIYPLHLAVRLFGEPSELSSKSKFLENGFEAEGNLALKYPGFTVSIRYSKIFDGKHESYIKGENGEIRFGKINSPSFLSIVSAGEELIKSFTPNKNNILTELDAFCDTVKGDSSYLHFNSVSEKTMSLIDMIYKTSGINFS